MQERIDKYLDREQQEQKARDNTNVTLREHLAPKFQQLFSDMHVEEILEDIRDTEWMVGEIENKGIQIDLGKEENGEYSWEARESMSLGVRWNELKSRAVWESDEVEIYIDSGYHEIISVGICFAQTRSVSTGKSKAHEEGCTVWCVSLGKHRHFVRQYDVNKTDIEDLAKAVAEFFVEDVLWRREGNDRVDYATIKQGDEAAVVKFLADSENQKIVKNNLKKQSFWRRLLGDTS